MNCVGIADLQFKKNHSIVYNQLLSVLMENLKCLKVNTKKQKGSFVIKFPCSKSEMSLFLLYCIKYTIFSSKPFQSAIKQTIF